MIRVVIQHVLQAIVALFIIAALAFMIGAFIGDPMSALLPLDASADDRAALRQNLGLDDPVFVRFFSFMFGALQGDFGISWRTLEPVSQSILQRLPATIELAVLSVILGVGLGIPGGVYTAINPKKFGTKIIQFLSVLGITLPNFLVGIYLIQLFSVELGWLNSFGRGETVMIGKYWSTGLLTTSGWSSIILPAITMSLFQITFILRMVRAQMLEVLQSDYIKFARARGIPKGSLLYRHSLKNTLLPVITVIGLQLGNIIAFAVVTEIVFSWPGLGTLFIQSVLAADMPTIAAYLILVGAVYSIVNLCIELLYMVIDPRTRT